MGLAIEREDFSADDYTRFDERLRRSLRALEELLERPDFGVGAASLGAELELALVGPDSRPLPLNIEVLSETLDPRVTFELNRFNLECNLRHTRLAGQPFATLAREFDDALAEVRRAAAAHSGRVVAIGILPTLVEADLQSGSMTDSVRFRALSKALQRLRDEPFHFDIDGEEPLEVQCNDVTFEGAATSLQIHLRVDPRRFAAQLNAAQLATAPVLAVSGNSPTFLGHKLWDETRVALFKQAVDYRGEHAKQTRREARVSFGTGWVRRGAHEIFAESVALHEALLPILGREDPLESMEAGRIPKLEEVRLHQGTVWRWNRPVYDPSAGGHLRIEFRALPAGPTTTDMLASAAFLIGLTLGLESEMDSIVENFPFEHAHRNFYRAAQSGLDSELYWPAMGGVAAGTFGARELIPRLLPLARRGLLEAGVESSDLDPLLAVIDERTASGITGAVWQRRTLGHLERRMDRRAALAEMVERYIASAEQGLPVHRWEIGSDSD